MIFQQKERAKHSKYRTSLIVEHHPENPPFRKWIQQGMRTLHLNPALRKLFPEVPVVTKQGKNVGRLAIKARHWRRDTPGDAFRMEGQNTVKHPDTGKKRAGACHTCRRMQQTNNFSSHATNRTYKIRSKGTLNCTTSWCIYFATCRDCPEAGYVGQTYAASTKNSKGGLYKRHCGHRADSKDGKGGLGGHYFDNN